MLWYHLTKDYTLLDKINGDNEGYYAQFAKLAAGNLNPMCAAIGGMVAQVRNEISRILNSGTKILDKRKNGKEDV